MPKTLKIILITTALIIVALGIMFYCLAVYDAPAPDDSAYKTTYTPVPPETNAIVTLNKLVGKVKTQLKDYPELDGYLSASNWNDRGTWDDILQGNRYDFELQVLFIVRNQEALAILSEAMRKPNAQFAPFTLKATPPLPSGPLTISDTHTFTDSRGVTHEVKFERINDQLFQPTLNSDFFNIYKIARMTWQNTKDGKPSLAWDDVLANFQFAKRFGAADNATLLNFLVALACQNIACELMLKNISSLEDRDIAIKITALLNDSVLTPADYKATFKADYEMIDDAVRGFEKVPRKTLLYRYMFKLNDTRQRALDRLATMCEAIDRGDCSLGIPPPPDFSNMNLVEKLAYGLRPNAAGRALLDLANANNMDNTYQSTLATLARLRVQACAFALRAYWLDHGKLPDSLDELAPVYIKAVPLDIFGGKPLQYDRAHAVVYSAGPKLVHSAGDFAREPTAHPADDRPFVLLDWDTQK